MGVLAHTLGELGFEKESSVVVEFVRRFRDVFVDVEASYIEARYGVYAPSRGVVGSLYRVARELFGLLDRVEDVVLD